MENFKDININIGKDKIRTGVIFLVGFATGGVSSVLFAKKKIKAKVETRALQQIEESHDLAQQSVNRACKALDKLTEKAKKLEEAVNEYDNRKSAKMEVR